MNLLAIETSTQACAIGISHGAKEDIRVLDLERRHTEVLAGGILEALSENGLVARDLIGWSLTSVQVCTRGCAWASRARLGSARDWDVRSSR